MSCWQLIGKSGFVGEPFGAIMAVWTLQGGAYESLPEPYRLNINYIQSGGTLPRASVGHNKLGSPAFGKSSRNDFRERPSAIIETVPVSCTRNRARGTRIGAPFERKHRVGPDPGPAHGSVRTIPGREATLLLGGRSCD